MKLKLLFPEYTLWWLSPHPSLWAQQQVWGFSSHGCLFKIQTQEPAQNPSWIPPGGRLCPHGQEQLCNSSTNQNESQAVKIIWLWWWNWWCANHNITWCPSDRFHTLWVLVLYHSCRGFIDTERAEKYEQTVTLGLIDISTFNYSSANRLKITSAAISNGSGRSGGLLSNCLHLPACPRLQNVVAFQVTSFVSTLLSTKSEKIIICSLV